MDDRSKWRAHVFIPFFFFIFLLIRDYFVSFAFKFHRKSASHRFTAVISNRILIGNESVYALVIYSWERDKINLLAFSSLYCFNK